MAAGQLDSVPSQFKKPGLENTQRTSSSQAKVDSISRLVADRSKLRRGNWLDGKGAQIKTARNGSQPNSLPRKALDTGNGQRLYEQTLSKPHRPVRSTGIDVLPPNGRRNSNDVSHSSSSGKEYALDVALNQKVCV